ncbi:MAG: hypothetical protein FWG53_03880 [Clostridiales bacterium]|nr:hypothetical protein [Clostridiales bacterium]
MSKIIRMGQKDMQDIDEMIAQCDKSQINAIVNGVLTRADLYEGKRRQFVKNLKTFRERYDV